jgi:hypothetical protein
VLYGILRALCVFSRLFYDAYGLLQVIYELFTEKRDPRTMGKKNFDMSKNLPQPSRILTSVCELWRVINGCWRVINECLRLTTSLRSVRTRKKNPWVWRGYKGRIPLPSIRVVYPLGHQCPLNCRQRNSKLHFMITIHLNIENISISDTSALAL